jgi:uncharacterized cupin superfamily protein
MFASISTLVPVLPAGADKNYAQRQNGKTVMRLLSWGNEEADQRNVGYNRHEHVMMQSERSPARQLIDADASNGK